MTDAPPLPPHRPPTCAGLLRAAARRPWLSCLPALAAGMVLVVSAAPAAAQGPRPAARPAGDYIIAIVNSELVTAGELEQRLAVVRANAERARANLPPADELRRQVLDALIDERVQVTAARDAGQRVDDAELDRAVANVATQNQITPAQLRERLRAEGVDYARFRNNLRDQIMVERVREREVQSRIRISDAEIDGWLEKQRETITTELSEQYGIPASVILAVAIVESSAGTGHAATRLNNHFGMVGKNNLKAEKKGYRSKYKQYDNDKDSFMDFCRVISNKDFYARLKDNMDCKEWVKAISRAGYSEKPIVWEKRILNTISSNKL